MDRRVMNQRTIRASAIFVGKNMANNTYKNMRIATTGLTFEDEWDRIYLEEP
jgi:hypothetical protein